MGQAFAIIRNIRISKIARPRRRPISSRTECLNLLHKDNEDGNVRDIANILNQCLIPRTNLPMTSETISQTYWIYDMAFIHKSFEFTDSDNPA